MLLLNKYVYEEKNLDKAFEKFTQETNYNKEDILYISKEEKGGLLKSSKVTLEIVVKEDIINFINEYFLNLSNGLGIEINSDITIEDDILNINLSSNDASALIGKNGKMLNSLQVLVRKMLEVNSNVNLKVNLDVENYKKRKISYLERDVKKIIKEVLKTKVDVKLDPMNSYERRIVHNLVSNYGQLTSESEGESPNRCVVIKYIEG